MREKVVGMRGCNCNNVHSRSAAFLVLLLFWLACSILIYRSVQQPKRWFCAEKTSAAEVADIKPMASQTAPASRSIGKVSDAEEIQMIIERENRMQTIRNEDAYSPLDNDSLIIVVQVHHRPRYLRQTVLSLAEAKGIESTLLIFSHDYFDEHINHIVQSIEFCKVMQIFYPFSVQTHLNGFPGEDCPSGVGKTETEEQNCSDSKHHRNARRTQLKHHWWWKANHVFDELNVTKDYTGLFLWLEEDHYVAPDFIHMVHLTETFKQSRCPQCKMLNVGCGDLPAGFALYSNKAEIAPWVDNLGMVFNRSVWNDLKSCAHAFCTFNDYNWDWTLLAVTTNCIEQGLTAMALHATRIYHIGECGEHVHNDCNSTNRLRRIQMLLEQESRHLFPRKLLLTGVNEYHKQPIANGGWDDARDHDLCLKMVKSP